MADKVIVQGILGNTVGRVGKIAGRLLLGRVPDTAKEGSFQEEKPLEDAAPKPPVSDEADSTPASELAIENVDTERSAKYIDNVNGDDQSALEEEIFDQVFANGSTAANCDSSIEREWKVPEPQKEKELSTV